MSLKQKANDALKQLKTMLHTEAGKALYGDLHRYIVSLRKDRSGANQKIEQLEEAFKAYSSQRKGLEKKVEELRLQVVSAGVERDKANHKANTLARELASFKQKQVSQEKGIVLRDKKLGALTKKLINSCPVCPRIVHRFPCPLGEEGEMIAFSLQSLVENAEAPTNEDLTRIGLFSIHNCLLWGGVAFLAGNESKRFKEARGELREMPAYIRWASGSIVQKLSKAEKMQFLPRK